MKLNLGDRKLLLLFAIIVLLLAANIYFMVQPKQSDELSMYKAFAAQTHSSMQGIKTESAQLAGTIDETQDLNAEEKQQRELLRQFYFSLDADVGWIAEKENTVYWELLATQNPLKANELMRKEMALMVVGNYVFSLNNDSINDAMGNALDKSETVTEAKSVLPWIRVKDLLNDSIAQEMISETLLKKEDIISESKEIMGQYLELRKKALNEAKKGSDAEFVEAVKLLELSYLLELNAESQSTV